MQSEQREPESEGTAEPPSEPSPAARRGWRARLSGLRIDISPLRVSRDYRLLMGSGMITMFGSFVTFVAVPVQIKELTGSYVAVGLVGVAELVPMVLFGLYGGALADALDRKRLVVLCEIGLMLCSALLLANAVLPQPQIWPLYVIVAAVAALDSLQRPSLDGLVPRYVPHDKLASAAALGSMRWNIGAILGPALGGLVVTGGVELAYGLDIITFGLSLVLLWRLRPAPAADDAEPAGLRSIVTGLRYAMSRRDLVGTYVVDMAAMMFAMPQALFPFLADELQAPWALGLLYSAGAVGSMIAALTSGWTARVHRHGLGVILGAAGWGAAIALVGLSSNLAVVLVCLALAGAADMISGLFRSTIWNQSIPDHLRGRMAGVELLSYSIGPMLGNARAGLMASVGGLSFAIFAGGVACVGAVAALTAALPTFRRYDASTDEHVLAEKERRAAIG